MHIRGVGPLLGAIEGEAFAVRRQANRLMGRGKLVVGGHKTMPKKKKKSHHLLYALSRLTKRSTSTYDVAIVIILNESSYYLR